MTQIGTGGVACRSVLALGGARSGKSAYAQRLAEGAAAERLYLASGQPGDAEMARRIALHRAARGAGWATRETATEVAAALAEEARPGRAVLFDCLTLWLSNLMFEGRDLQREIDRLCAAIRVARGPLIVVSNEVGAGIVPDTKLGREFRDWQGRANQDVAEACDAVVLVTAGLPALLKPAPRPALDLA